ncbi:MAG TPA: acetate--CoA ligase family protein, partial [Candidatus Binatia bacterium]|nr:acetate--CoA ligase family protein [Candidatus Binatia bacterium]
KAVEAILSVGKNGSMLPHEATAQLLGAYGFACAEFKIASDADEAASAAAKIGYPVILKGIAPDIAHRSDAGLVSGKIDDEAALRRSFTTLQRNVGTHARVEVSVERYLPHDFEVILGVKYDETFGPVVLCGLGGIFTEVLKDYALRLAPLTRTQAEDMLSSLKTFAALKKSTNGTAHIESIIEKIVDLSNLAVDLRGRIRAVDINPIGITLGSPAITVLDAKTHL